MMWTELKAQIKCMSVLAEVAKQTERLEEKITGRVRIQKTLYLLKQCGLAELERIDFVYHHYGPFSHTVAESLADAVNEHVLYEERESFASKAGDERLLYRYMPGSNVDEYACDVDDGSRRLIERVVKRVKDEYWRTLELAATVHYLEQAKHLDREQACERAIGLKPPCEPYRQAALALLQDLGL